MFLLESQTVRQIDEENSAELEEEGEEDEDEGRRKEKPNMMILLFYFEQTDVGLPRGEIVVLNLSIRKLMVDAPIRNVR